MNESKIKIDIYAPNLPKKELIGVLYIQLNEPIENIYLSELPKQSGYRPSEIEVRIKNDHYLLVKFFEQLFNVANKLGGTKGVVKVNGEIIFDSWFNPRKSRPELVIPNSRDELKVEIY